MKKLQNNFTTPEQSKRLLELGVPKWTADCYYEVFPEGIRVKPSEFFVPSDPCWSVGRLIEIWLLCNNSLFSVPLTLCIDRQTKDVVYLMINLLKKQKMDGTNFALLKEYYE